MKLALITLFFMVQIFAKDKAVKELDPLLKIPKPELIRNILPLEFEMVFDYVSKYLPRKRRLEFLELAHHLNNNFKKVPKENLFFYLKAEVYRSLIEYEFDIYIQKIDVNPSFLNKLEQKVNASAALYDSFAVWLIRAMINDFDPYFENPIFQNINQAKKGSEEDMKTAAEIRRKLNYLNKWFYVADKYDPDQFSKLTYRVAWKILYNLKSYMNVLGFFGGKIHLEKPPEYFQLPSLEPYAKQLAELNYDAPLDETSIMNLEKIALDEAAKAQKIVGKIDEPLVLQPPATTTLQPIFDPSAQQILGGGEYQAYDPNNDYLMGAPQDPNLQNQNSGELPWIPDEYTGELNALPNQDPNYIETPDGRKYKDGVYIVPQGDKKAKATGASDEEDAADGADAGEAGDE